MSLTPISFLTPHSSIGLWYRLLPSGSAILFSWTCSQGHPWLQCHHILIVEPHLAWFIIPFSWNTSLPLASHLSVHPLASPLCPLFPLSLDGDFLVSYILTVVFCPIIDLFTRFYLASSLMWLKYHYDYISFQLENSPWMFPIANEQPSTEVYHAQLLSHHPKPLSLIFSVPSFLSHNELPLFLSFYIF